MKQPHAPPTVSKKEREMRRKPWKEQLKELRGIGDDLDKLKKWFDEQKRKQF